MAQIWTRWSQQLGLLSSLGGALVFLGDCALAQITPDGTLGAERSTVTRDVNIKGLPSHQIEGGAKRGANLFHSFREFNIDEGRGAYFTNPAGIENILSRVTGGSLSDIQGTLGVLGKANLFLINPNGIIFGPNASLDVQGSFVATTADAVQFDNQGFFNTSEPSSPPLLTVNPSAFLFNQIAHRSIENNSIAPAGVGPSGLVNAFGLRVPDGQTLLLLGGNVTMNSGGLFAFGGRVELGGVTGAGTIGLNGGGNNLRLSFPNSVERSDVFLSNSAGVYVAASDDGSIAVNARNLEMTKGSFLRAGIKSGSGSDTSQAGNIEVNAAGAVNLNNESFITNQVLPKASGLGGDVSISASTLQVEEGTQVGTATRGKGKGGNLTVDAQDVQLIGTTADGQFPSALGASAQLNSTGDAGDLTINTQTLQVQDGAEVSAGAFGKGKGGNLTVNAQEVQLIGTSNDGRSSNVSAATYSTGDAGDLTINTQTLQVQDGAQVSAGAFGKGKGGNLTVNAQDVQLIASNLFTAAQPNSTGDAGDLTINTQTLRVQNGAQVSAGTFGAGKGGNLTVDTQDVQLIGESDNSLFPSGLFTSAELNLSGDAGDLTINTQTLRVQDGAEVSASAAGKGKGGDLTVNAQDVQLIGRSANPQFASNLSASAQPNSTGDAGDLTINTQTLRVQDGAGVSVQSFGTGTAGIMALNARSIRLDDNATLTANTQSTKVDPNSEQATININSQDLVMSSTSNIFTNATGENVIGGNININTDVLAALENSDISANAEEAFGGQVIIDAQGIFGTEFREDLTPQSDITATSELGPEFSGTVEINTPDIDPSQGVVDLPEEVVDVSGLVAQKCPAGGGTVASRASKFVVTGRGGLPPNPTDPPSSDTVLADWITLNPKMEETRSGPTPAMNSTSSTPIPLVEAQGWVRDSKGQVVLTAQTPRVTPHSLGLKSGGCRRS